ncbi:hypothetical protein CEK25_002879 [Fusarium fujikuroi]|nr:hypothetical protein CEK25_002879 [Fusarium fujikuroi]
MASSTAPFIHSQLIPCSLTNLLNHGSRNSLHLSATAADPANTKDTACYDSDANSLLLYDLQGTHVDITNGQPLSKIDGGLLFDLPKLVYPSDNVTVNTTNHGQFDIELPNMVYPSDTVGSTLENHKRMGG